MLSDRPDFCVGRNYEAHATEMGFKVDREAPFYFNKAASTFVASGSTIPYPPGTSNYHYEMELVVAIGKQAFQISEAEAGSIIYGFACGLDMTRRDLQLVAREKGRPWDLGKDFEQSAVVAPITKAAQFAIENQRISLSVNGEIKQDQVLADLVWSVPELIADLSRFYHLAPGDLIFTGTPAGVGPVVAGDTLEGTIDGLTPVQLVIGPGE
ncbi:fumarylacetoacetate (FAA) hydrolase (plasmid) [Rhizorhabdus wittichii RW1]|uniref:Fumarylacetoacetate (FAA) hydrolase n=1 Tax=Rhizorhabdus wittichii (strain DSM 6014 / CCUG 31198 / JCM 15750 / NBRC 105917 / EY 4224 / RW1) TaxID=392499 RepID=A0A9J9HHL7_RHIWR|nr:fumarylacetoacetate (FAA) hydrolase [Rhizorhabdus wittichii RW1]